MHEQSLKPRLIVSLVLGIPVMLLSMIPAWQFWGWQWVVAALALPVVTWCAWPFHKPAFKNLRHGAFTMDTLVSLGVLAATLWSFWALFFGGAGQLGMRMSMSFFPRHNTDAHAHIYFEGATMVVAFLLAGRYAEGRARRQAAGALRALLDLGAKTATLLEVDASGRESERVIPASELQVGDIFVVRPGEKVATDGVIVRGTSAIDASLLTGESVPVEVAQGDQVTGATLNTSGVLRVEATRVGSETTLAQIGRMVEQAQAGKAPVQRLADKVAGVFVPVVMGLSLLTLILWLVLGSSVQGAFTAAVSVLVIACPCALGLATPMALLVGSGRAAQLGILLRGPEVLEAAHNLDTIVLDKTGTVTSGEMSVRQAYPLAQVSEAELLAAAAFAEGPSEHPIAKAISQSSSVPADFGQVADFVNLPGRGVFTVSDSGRAFFAGRPEWIATLTGVAASQLTPAEAVDATLVAVASANLADLGLTAGTAGSLNTEADDVTDNAGDGVDAVDFKPATQLVKLDVQGMTCASCVGRVEKKLGKLPGVSAIVNLATNSAEVHTPADLDPQVLQDTVIKAGYEAKVLSSALEGGAQAATQGDQAKAMSTSQAQSAGNANSAGTSQPGATTPLSQVDVEQILNLENKAQALGTIAVADTVKASSAQAIKQFKELGMEPILLTGDNQSVADAVAKQVGIERVIAQVLPADKQQQVKALQDQGRVVAMVGDGVNDAGALAQAGNRGLGMAMGSGTDVAMEAADVTLVRSDLTSVGAAVRISRATLRNIKQNLGWAFGYNLIAIPLAMLGWMNPMIAGACMAFSSVAVVLNSLRLRSLERDSK
ncbi:ATPase P [Boudabousia liubingyangii]|uniref:Cation-transporting P-type ATPase B n=1 Tax=Boudabousia liubingyangii TaxID=1921764 RepID=A0A1Q5PKB0_9ACTO|nr:heavy metal translocating P-type ATPase [Boudabousia liubingyangii]OKL46653.1 ATPase P [Boudabousia liubingyangii]